MKLNQKSWEHLVVASVAAALVFPVLHFLFSRPLIAGYAIVPSFLQIILMEME